LSEDRPDPALRIATAHRESKTMSPKRVKETAPVDVAMLSYEAAAAELDAIVTRLEAGNIPLDETVQLFERGQRLAAHCNQLLDAAELKVKTLTATSSDDDEQT
jgi:exodeoxyribonuclease VII small subunit